MKITSKITCYLIHNSIYYCLLRIITRCQLILRNDDELDVIPRSQQNRHKIQMLQIVQCMLHFLQA